MTIFLPENQSLKFMTLHLKSQHYHRNLHAKFSSHEIKSTLKIMCQIPIKTKQRRCRKGQTDEKDEIYETLNQLWGIDIVHSLTIKKDVFFFITSTEKIAQVIKKILLCSKLFCSWSEHNLQFMQCVGNRYVLS